MEMMEKIWLNSLITNVEKKKHMVMRESEPLAIFDLRISFAEFSTCILFFQYFNQTFIYIQDFPSNFLRFKNSNSFKLF